jgi:hypothetical protein
LCGNFLWNVTRNIVHQDWACKGRGRPAIRWCRIPSGGPSPAMVGNGRIKLVIVAVNLSTPMPQHRTPLRYPGKVLAATTQK